MLPRAVRPLARALGITRIATPPRILPCSHLACRTASLRFIASTAGPDASTVQQPDPQNAVDTSKIDAAEAQSILSVCPGCGAMAQTVATGEAGYFDLDRGAVKRYLKQAGERQASSQTGAQNAVFANALSNADSHLAQELRALKKSSDEAARQESPPVCDRCHNLLHHNRGAPIYHPSVESLQDTIEESPHKHNHIYHVIDAADFPMSLVHSIQYLLSANPLRSRNRRARAATYKRGKKIELSFIITRSDLMAPRKEQVDRLMPRIVNILRSALGRAGQNARLGNVYLVSAKRGWWTRDLKEAIWKRGGAGWMVGKVNVGKSNLFQAVFPKGKAENINFDSMRSKAKLIALPENTEQHTPSKESEPRPDASDEDSLLPPARLETPFPLMPTISALPGTTASPIRIPFGNGRGELIDLPGLARSALEEFVRPEHRDKLIMESRIAPEQYNLRSGSSLLLGGGLVRITPRTEGLTFLAYPFVPIHASVRTDQELADNLPTSSAHTIAAEGVSQNLCSAGRFRLRSDVTKQRAGPLTRKDAAGLKPEILPFKVLSTEILIESVGWVELVVQVRRKDFPDRAHDLVFPEVEVFSPSGRFIQAREPLSLWEGSKPKRAPSKRPRTVFSKLKSNVS